MVLCTFYQWYVRQKSTLTEANLSGRLSRHLENCHDCRDYYRRLTRLETQLQTASADRLTAAQHSRIKAAVLRRFSHTARTPLRPSRTVRRVWLPVGAAAAAAAILLVGLSVFFVTSPPTLEPSFDPVQVTAIWSESEKVGELFSQLAFLPEQIMQTEMSRLSDDVQRACQFVLNSTAHHLIWNDSPQ